MAAAELLRQGQIVAIPTETVYGLAANALDGAAVRKIFEAKGRPSHNPLIVHVASVDAARQLTAEWPPEADLLASAFWPGPLTIILPRRAGIIPDVVTAGGATVALRCPQHPVALDLLKLCSFPLAAPSANRSNAVSPTTAEHVARSLGGRVPLIIDGGPCAAGIESTVLDLSGEAPRILRPGSITGGQLSEVLGREVLTMRRTEEAQGEVPERPAPLISPGLLTTHYAPDTPLVLLPGADLRRMIQQDSREHDSAPPVGLIIYSEELRSQAGSLRDKRIVEMPAAPAEYAQRLYAELHRLDSCGLRIIYCETPPQEPAWAGVNDRLRRAAQNG